MIEKRFTFIQDSLVKADVFDEETGDFICCTLSVWVEQLVNLLNGLDGTIKDLSDDYQKLMGENNELKQRITELEKEVNSLSDGEADWLIDEML